MIRALSKHVYKYMTYSIITYISIIKWPALKYNCIPTKYLVTIITNTHSTDAYWSMLKVLAAEEELIIPILKTRVLHMSCAAINLARGWTEELRSLCVSIHQVDDHHRSFYAYRYSHDYQTKWGKPYTGSSACLYAPG